MFEVEVKAQVKDSEQLKRILLGEGAKQLATERHVDHVYGIPSHFPPENGEVIARIREKDEKITFEFKEIDRRAGGIELENPISAVEPFHRFLLKMQFKHFFTMEKTRTSFLLNGLCICFDTIPELGSFIEIEKMVSKESEKESALKEVNSFLKLWAPDAVICAEKYGDMLCTKLCIKR